MAALTIVLRLIHILLGVFWAGTIFFLVSFLEPSIRGAGPAGGQVMQQLNARRFLTHLPIIAALTILSGFGLYWRVSAGFEPAWMGSPVGVTLGIGAAAALVAFAIGVFVMRPATIKVLQLAPSLQQMAEGPERAARMAEIDGLRTRSRMAARTVASLLAITVAAMAIARYL
jgi:uncharacterized membrane protein